MNSVSPEYCKVFWKELLSKYSPQFLIELFKNRDPKIAGQWSAIVRAETRYDPEEYCQRNFIFGGFIMAEKSEKDEKYQVYLKIEDNLGEILVDNLDSMNQDKDIADQKLQELGYVLL